MGFYGAGPETCPIRSHQSATGWYATEGDRSSWMSVLLRVVRPRLLLRPMGPQASLTITGQHDDPSRHRRRSSSFGGHRRRPMLPRAPVGVACASHSPRCPSGLRRRHGYPNATSPTKSITASRSESTPGLQHQHLNEHASSSAFIGPLLNVPRRNFDPLPGRHGRTPYARQRLRRAQPYTSVLPNGYETGWLQRLGQWNGYGSGNGGRPSPRSPPARRMAAIDHSTEDHGR